MVEANAHSRADLRMLGGYAVVPPTAVLIALVTYDVMWQAGLLPQGTPIDSLDSAGSLGMGLAILAVVMTVFGAVPTVVWLNRRQPLSLGRLLIAGAALGNVPFAFIILGVVAPHTGSGTLSAAVARFCDGMSGAVVRAAMGLICGTGSAAAFWFVGVRGTPACAPRQ